MQHESKPLSHFVAPSNSAALAFNYLYINLFDATFAFRPIHITFCPPYIFSGQVVGETAKTLSERFGKILQKRQSITINREISTLTQGMFVGAVADNFNERIEQKIFHCEIVVDADKVKREEQAYKPIPVITDFTDADGNDRMKEMIQENYNRIRAEVRQIVADELQRIQSDPELQHLLQGK